MLQKAFLRRFHLCRNMIYRSKPSKYPGKIVSGKGHSKCKGLRLNTLVVFEDWQAGLCVYVHEEGEEWQEIGWSGS